MANNRTMGYGDFVEVLAGAKAGEDAAWAVIFGELTGPVVGYLRARGASEPEDLASEAFLRVARSIATFEGDEKGFRSWVFTITHRLLLDEHRSRSRKPVTDSIDDTEHGQDRILSSVTSATSLGSAAPAEDLAERQWTNDEVVQLVGRLTDSQRDVILLRVVGGFSIDEVATLVDKPAGAVKQLQLRGLASLKRLLQADAADTAAAAGTLDAPDVADVADTTDTTGEPNESGR